MSSDFITLDGGQADLARGYEVGVWFHYANDPLVATVGGSQAAKVVTDQLALHLFGAYEFLDRVRVAVDLPLYLVQSVGNENVLGDVSGAGVGDLRFVPKVEIFDGRADGSDGFALAVVLPFWLPTGDGDKLQGEPFRARPTLALDWGSASGIRAGANIGFGIREETQAVNLGLNEEFTWGVGASVPLGRSPVDFVAEVDGSMPLGGGMASEELPLDFMGMFRLGAGSVTAGLGAGAGLNEGWGTPDVRAFGMVGYTPRARVEPEPEPVAVVVVAPPAPSDRDGDGILDEDDACPDVPEDFDGIDDADGCPEDDVDNDGILDPDDACPRVAEDIDGWEDGDGCPDPDNDGDRIVDEHDACRGVDGDALEDVQEVHNGYEDTDGCPDALAEVTDTHIRINDVIYFDVDSDVIQDRSLPIIDAVANVLIAHSDITMVMVEGHTDSRGSADYNRELSQRRTESVVRALVERGILERRLVPHGFGESELIDRGDTEEAHQRNRRVEFRIVEREEDGQ